MTDKSPVVEGMLSLHKIITRGLQVSIMKCDEYSGNQGIAPGEAEGFSMFATTLKWVIHSHHLTEDEIFFPYFRDKIEGPYDRLGDDHKTMTLILGDLDKSLPEISFGEVARVRGVLGELEMLWNPHIKKEEESFTAEKVLEVMSIPEQEIFARQIPGHSKRNLGPAPLALPFLFYNLEGNDRKAFMTQFPWFLKKVLVPVAWRGKWKPISQYLLV